MAITYTWAITAMKKAPSLDDLSDVITHVNFKYVGTDSETDSDGLAYTAEFSGACPIGSPTAETFTAMSEVTEADVISWAQANHPVEHMQEVIIDNINEQKIPKETPVDELPWA